MRIDPDLATRVTKIARIWGMNPGTLLNEMVSHALHGHNQTREEWFGTDPNELGTGVFAVPDVEGGDWKRVIVQNLTYFECVKRGREVTFQWVPHHVRTYEELASSSCGTGG